MCKKESLVVHTRYVHEREEDVGLQSMGYHLNIQTYYKLCLDCHYFAYVIVGRRDSDGNRNPICFQVVKRLKTPVSKTGIGGSNPSLEIAAKPQIK